MLLPSSWQITTQLKKWPSECQAKYYVVFCVMVTLIHNFGSLTIGHGAQSLQKGEESLYVVATTANQCRSSRRCATHSVLARAQAVFDAKPSTSTAAPLAVITNQITCVDVVKSIPCARPAATTVPDTATPSDALTCRLVDAIPAATPT